MVSFQELWKSHRTLLIAALAAVSAFCGLWYVSAPMSGEFAEPQEVVIAPGQGVRQVAGALKAGGFIRSETLFITLAVLSGAERNLQAGTYILSQNMSPFAILRSIARGEALSSDISVTFREGMNTWEMDAALTTSGLRTTPGGFSRLWQKREGYLFPDTYRFSPGTTAQDVGSQLEATYHQKAGAIPRDGVIIASLLEKEARTKEDMQLVAGIIKKRIELGMLLQVDASVAYGWCLRTAGTGTPCDVTQAPIALEIKKDGPYNTYMRPGLPEGPISNPGLVALWAAAHPTASDYLYYLSTRDGSQIIYAKTLTEHLRNRAKYLGL